MRPDDLAGHRGFGAAVRRPWKRSLRTVGAELWPVAQQSAAATAAWLVATHLVHHHQPFFAPIAAVVSLNTPLGERGLNALRLLLGTLTGIVAGELAVHLLGNGYRALAVSSFVAMAVARALAAARIVTAQAAAGAILTVATTPGSGSAGPARLVDALIGAAVALVFSQLLFTPRPVALLHRAERAALSDVASGLRLTAQAVADGDDTAAERAVNRLRDLRDRLTELARTRRVSRRVVAHSLLWRSQRSQVVRDSENAGVLDLLSGSALMLARTAMTVPAADRDLFVAQVRELADVIGALAAAPGDRAVRQRAADRTLTLLQRVTLDRSQRRGSAGGLALMLAAGDVLRFAGLEPEQSVD